MSKQVDGSERFLRALNKGHRWFVTAAGFVALLLMIEKFWPKSFVAQLVRAIWP